MSVRMFPAACVPVSPAPVSFSTAAVLTEVSAVAVSPLTGTAALCCCVWFGMDVSANAGIPAPVQAAVSASHSAPSRLTHLFPVFFVLLSTFPVIFPREPFPP
ncbi:hypothetical protein [uncultured Subdoligranulum sp.]|uniref:hypothetical protein n=1 Tax=uncultured Subdoligranulum sp. TaxID=512298 RepID=UPI0032088578